MDEKKKIAVSASSLVGLKAELLRKQAQFKQEKLAKASGEFSSGKFVKTEKKSSIWRKQNAGVKLRMKKDEAESKDENAKDLENSRAMLEAKAKIYEKMATGQMEANEQTNSVFLVDFEKKQLDTLQQNHAMRTSAKEEDDDENDILVNESEIPPAAIPEEEWVDYIDTLGRSRRCMRKDLPMVKDMDKKLNPDKFRDKEQASSSVDDAVPQMMSADMHREMLRKKWEKEQADLLEKGDIHYQNVRFDEVRELGVGYFDFSKDEEERKKQMESLSNLRDETMNKREQRQRLKAKRKAALQERLEKVKQRRNIKTEDNSNPVVAMTSSEETKVGNEETRSNEELSKNISGKEKRRNDANLDRTVKLLAKIKESTKPVREWDIGKVLKPSAWEKQQEKERDERPSEFAPPSVYFNERTLHQAKGKHNRNTQKKNENIAGTSTHDISDSPSSYPQSDRTIPQSFYPPSTSEPGQPSQNFYSASIKETLAFYRNKSS